MHREGHQPSLRSGSERSEAILSEREAGGASTLVRAAARRGKWRDGTPSRCANRCEPGREGRGSVFSRALEGEERRDRRRAGAPTSGADVTGQRPGRACEN